jgi:5-methyltetrahydrofolate--homocysteine methyltransferase
VIPFRDRLRRAAVVVGDGAIGTQLMARGLRSGQPPEIFNLDRPEVLREIAEAYLVAGAEILTTNTFGAAPLNLRRHALDDRTEEINRNAVQAVREAAGDRAYVSASMGPCGAILKPYGDVEEEEVYASFLRQARALAEAGSNLFCVETMSDLREAVLAVRAAKTAAPELPVVATMTFESTPRGFYTIMGTGVEAACSGLEEAGADLVGTNCGFGIETMVELAGVFALHAAVPVVVQSNAGIPENRGGEVVYPESPAFMADHVPALIALGVAVVGGCCGTTPEHIRAIRRVVDATQGPSSPG